MPDLMSEGQPKRRLDARALAFAPLAALVVGGALSHFVPGCSAEDTTEPTGDDEPGIAELAMRSVQVLCAALGIERRFLRSSQGFAGSRGLPRAERLAAITRALGATRYVNSPGGDALYTREEFAALGVSLRFVRPRLPPYPQMGSTGFVAGLSVVDALMNNPLPEVARLARQFVLD